MIKTEEKNKPKCTSIQSNPIIQYKTKKQKIQQEDLYDFWKVHTLKTNYNP